MRILQPGTRRWTCSVAMTPSMTGMRTSIKITSGFIFTACSSASCPLAAVPVPMIWIPSWMLSSEAIPSRINCWSSTTNTRTTSCHILSLAHAFTPVIPGSCYAHFLPSGLLGRLHTGRCLHLVYFLTASFPRPVPAVPVPLVSRSFPHGLLAARQAFLAQPPAHYLSGTRWCCPLQIPTTCATSLLQS